MRKLAFTLALLLPAAVLAQTAPAPAPTPAPAPAAPAKKQAFTNALTGEHEAPLGLYIVPWRNSDAEGGAGRPARMMDEALTAHDADVFDRQVEYYRALSAHLEQTGRVTP